MFELGIAFWLIAGPLALLGLWLIVSAKLRRQRPAQIFGAFGKLLKAPKGSKNGAAKKVKEVESITAKPPRAEPWDDLVQ